MAISPCASVRTEDSTKPSDHAKRQVAILKVFTVRLFPVVRDTYHIHADVHHPATLFIAEKVCEPFGGILTNPIDYNTLVANGTIPSGNGTNVGTNVTVGSPAPSPFVGEGTQSRGSGSIALILTGFAVITAYMML